MLDNSKEITEQMDNVLSGPVKPNYVPFGEDWEKEMMLNTKQQLVELIKNAYKERNALKKHHDLTVGLWATDKPELIKGYENVFFQITDVKHNR